MEITLKSLTLIQRWIEQSRQEAERRERLNLRSCDFCQAEIHRDTSPCPKCGHDPDELPF